MGVFVFVSVSVTSWAGMQRGLPPPTLRCQGLRTPALTGLRGTGGGDTKVIKGGGTPYNPATRSSPLRLLHDSRSLGLFFSFTSWGALGDAGAEGGSGGSDGRVLTGAPHLEQLMLAATTTRMVLKPLSSTCWDTRGDSELTLPSSCAPRWQTFKSRAVDPKEHSKGHGTLCGKKHSSPVPNQGGSEASPAAACGLVCL